MRLLLLISIIFPLACNSHLKSQKVTIDHTSMLYGEITKEQLYFDFPAWKDLEDSYNPDKNILKQIADYNTDTEVLIFLGTWCGDSRRNVPRFFKSIRGNNHFKTQIFAVDRKKEIDNNFHKKYNIKRVPTFIFFQGNNELGRIVERPDKSMEEDIAAILNNNKIISKHKNQENNGQ